MMLPSPILILPIPQNVAKFFSWFQNPVWTLWSTFLEVGSYTYSKLVRCKCLKYHLTNLSLTNLSLHFGLCFLICIQSSHLAYTGTATGYCGDSYSQSGKIKDYILSFRVYLITFTKENMFYKMINEFLIVVRKFFL